MRLREYLDCPYQLVRNQLNALLATAVRNPYVPLDPQTGLARLDLAVLPIPQYVLGFFFFCGRFVFEE